MNVTSNHTHEVAPAPIVRRWVDAVALTAIVALASALRCWRLDDRALWFDEAFSWRLTRFDWGEMLHRAALDNNPPLYYLLLKLWTACFGESAAGMRGLSVLCGAAASVATYLLVEEAYRYGDSPRSLPAGRARWTALLAAALAATSVLQIRWSWETRMYSLGAALAALSSWLLVRALHARPGGLRAWLLYSLAALAFAYTHTFALLSLTGQVVFAVAHLALARVGPRKLFNGAPWRGALLAAALVAAGYAPWLPVLLRQRDQVRASFWIRPVTWQSVPMAAYQMFVDPMEGPEDNREGWICAALSVVVLVSLVWHSTAGDWLLLVSVLFPIGLAAGISDWDTAIFHPRYLIFAHVFLLAAVARLAGRVRPLLERTIVAVMLLATFLLIDWDFFDRLNAEPSGIRAAAEHVRANSHPGEPVIVCSPYFYLPIAYYCGSDANCRLIDSVQPLRHFEGTAVLAPRDFISLAEVADSDAPRVWVVDCGARAAPCALPSTRWRRASQRSFYESYVIRDTLTVVEYERMPR